MNYQNKKKTITCGRTLRVLFSLDAQGLADVWLIKGRHDPNING